MTVIGDEIRRSWGECVWTAPDLLQPIRIQVPMGIEPTLDRVPGVSPCFVMCGRPLCWRVGCVRVYA